MIQSMLMACKVAGYKMKKLFSDEKGEVNIVATVVLIGIAVLLAVVFKDFITKELLPGLFDTIKGNATKAVEK